MTLPVVFTANGPSGYNLTKSLRFRSSASAYFQRTPASNATSSQKFTYSTWVKRGVIGTQSCLLEGGSSANSDLLVIGWGAYQDTLVFQAAGTYVIVTSAVYRDPSSWYHICLAVDTTQATASNRVKLYVNGSLVTAYQVDNRSSTTTQNYNFSYLNQNSYIQSIARSYYYGYYFDGYMAETVMVDGQQLAVTAFGSTNALTGVWQPAKYTGTYGTNGFYLPFTNTTSTTTLGYDFSGNSNNWTTNNLSLTAGSTYDSMTDVPTLTSATTANYAVLNPLNNPSSATVLDGNLKATGNSNYKVLPSTIQISSGKWYWELTALSPTRNAVGIATYNSADLTTSGNFLGQSSTSWSMFVEGTNAIKKYNNGTATAFSPALTASANDIFMVAMDVDNGKIYFGKNGTWADSSDPTTNTNPAFSGLTGPFFPAMSVYDSTGAAINFGQRPFAYTPPTGFVALNTYNLPTSTIVQGNKYMDVNTWTGTGATNVITNSGSMKPDFVWMKGRSNATYHMLTNSVTGSTKYLYSNDTLAEGTWTDQLTSFNSNGFTLGADTNGTTNYSGRTYVGWQWQAGQGTTSSNTNGSITSTVSVNASAGFSVSTFTSPSSGTCSFGHGLGVTPAFVIVKSRASGNWICEHTSTGTQYLLLNSTSAATTDSTVFNSAPTSTVVNLGTGFAGSVNYVAYCWAEIAGFSKFGSYTGNGSSNGTFIYTGFRPKYIMIKRTDSTGNWVLQDTSRSPYNQSQANLYANLSNPEDTGTTYLDILSNGFKCRVNENNSNINGGTYIYAAFAENPFKNALAR